MYFFVSLGLIMIGVLIGVGLTGQEFLIGIVEANIPYGLLHDFKGILIAVATGVYASLVVARYQELKDAKIQVAKEWVVLMHPFVLGRHVSSSDESVIRIKAELSSARMRMSVFYQQKAYQDYADAINAFSKLVDRRSTLKKDFSKPYLEIFSRLQNVNLEILPILLLRKNKKLPALY